MSASADTDNIAGGKRKEDEDLASRLAQAERQRQVAESIHQQVPWDRNGNGQPASERSSESLGGFLGDEAKRLVGQRARDFGSRAKSAAKAAPGKVARAAKSEVRHAFLTKPDHIIGTKPQIIKTEYLKGRSFARGYAKDRGRGQDLFTGHRATQFPGLVHEGGISRYPSLVKSPYLPNLNLSLKVERPRFDQHFLSMPRMSLASHRQSQRPARGQFGQNAASQNAPLMQFWRMVGPFSMSVFAPAASASRVVRRLEVKSKRRRRH